MVTRLDELKESVRFQACVCEDIGMHVTDANMLLAVAEAAAVLGDAYRTWDDSLVAGPSPVRLMALLRDVLMAAGNVREAVAPLMEEAE